MASMKVGQQVLAALVAAVIVPIIVGQQEEPPWWAAVSSYHFPHIYATDLENFVPQLENSTADFVLIDFYAPWCPHCQHFAPDYERLALAIQRFDDAKDKVALAPAPSRKPKILSATVDCVRFAATCDFWSVHSYPTLMWGRREDWIRKASVSRQRPPVTPAEQSNGDDAGGDASATKDASDIVPIDMDGTAESVVKWINNLTAIGLDISGISKKEVVRLLHHHEASSGTVASARSAPAVPRPAAGSPGAADLWDAQLASALLLRDILQHHAFEDEGGEAGQARRSGRRRHVKPKAKSAKTTRSAFLDFVGLLAARFPTTSVEGGRCRSSFVELHEQLRDNWAGMTHDVTTLQSMASKTRLVMIDPDWLEGQWQLCGSDWSRFREGWHSCRGTWPGKRGFTCGLWTMMHFLAAQTTDETALGDLRTVRSALAHFFDCQECREHFLQIPEPQGSNFTRRDAQLWWWNAHNVVNRRVGKLEIMYDDGDPAFPKSQWPTEADCPACRRVPAAQPARRLRRRGVPGAAAETITALGTVSVSPPAQDPPAAAVVGDKAAAEVPVESVTLAEAVEREHWDLAEVGAFLDSQYGAPSI